MDLITLLDMVAGGMPDRVLIGSLDGGLTGADLRGRTVAGSAYVEKTGASTVVFLGGNGPDFPVALFSAAAAGKPFLPLNFRLGDDQLTEILGRSDSGLLVTDTPERARLVAPHLEVVSLDEFREITADGDPDGPLTPADPDSIAVLLMTSGTTAAPKSAVLRHTNLTSYILGSVEFASVEEGDATIVSVPPYHIAAVANLLSNIYAGRRIVYLDRFTASEWLETVRKEKITNAMVVPTMLARIVDELETTGQKPPETLRALSYGGAKVAAPVIAKALELFPNTGFVNAYGLTETSSSIAVLGPEDHREALESDDPAVRARLSSVGRALPSVEIIARDENGEPCAPGVVGDIMVRGPQVAGEYLEGGSRVENDGWFPTRDRGHIDSEGYIFIEGRADDTIIRGGENIAPAEIEDVIVQHPAVAEVAVAGVPDDEWGQRIAAFVVVKSGATLDEDELKAFVRERLRGSKTPDIVQLLPELPSTATGKILRRVLVDELAAK